jgi:hypothetical protein
VRFEEPEEMSAISSLLWNAWRVFRFFVAAPFGAMAVYLLFLCAQAGGSDGLGAFVLAYAVAMATVAFGLLRSKSVLGVSVSLTGGGLLIGVAVFFMHALSRAHF